MTIIAGIAMAKAQKDQQRAQELMHWQRAVYAMCVRNFTEYHGCPPCRSISKSVLMDEYSRPWRKTTIPKVKP